MQRSSIRISLTQAQIYQTIELARSLDIPTMNVSYSKIVTTLYWRVLSSAIASGKVAPISDEEAQHLLEDHKEPATLPDDIMGGL